MIYDVTIEPFSVSFKYTDDYKTRHYTVPCAYLNGEDLWTIYDGSMFNISEVSEFIDNHKDTYWTLPVVIDYIQNIINEDSITAEDIELLLAK